MTTPAPTGPAPFTLDDLRMTIERKYGPFRIDMPDDRPVTFRQIVRLNGEQRTRVFALLAELRALNPKDTEDTDGEPVDEQDEGRVVETQVRILRDVLYLVAEGDDADRLFSALGPGSNDDIGVLMPLWDQYQDVTQPGEASPSGS